MKYKLVIFDLDGTLLNTLEDLARSTNYALSQNNLPLRRVMEVRQFVGNGIGKLIERAVPAGTDEKLREKVLKDFTENYLEHCKDNTSPYLGIDQLLWALKDAKVKTAVVSNKADDGVQALCKQYFTGLFDYSAGEKNGIRRKPAPDSVNAVLSKLKIEKKDAVYIGDSEVDIETAKNAGLDVISVSWGFRDGDVLKAAGAEKIVNSIDELWNALQA